MDFEFVWYFMDLFGFVVVEWNDIYFLGGLGGSLPPRSYIFRGSMGQQLPGEEQKHQFFGGGGGDFFMSFVKEISQQCLRILCILSKTNYLINTIDNMGNTRFLGTSAVFLKHNLWCFLATKLKKKSNA